MRSFLISTVVLVAPVIVSAQAPAPHPAPVQITAAVAPLPANFREGATVLGYVAGKKGLVPLRDGKNSFICLADDPAEERFHVACYHNSLEPFMVRGRELRAQGVSNVDSARFAEIESGKLKMAKGPAALYSLTAPKPNADGSVVAGARALFVVYTPFATEENSGLGVRPAGTTPWIMFAGTAKAHIMFTPTMN